MPLCIHAHIHCSHALHLWTLASAFRWLCFQEYLCLFIILCVFAVHLLAAGGLLTSTTHPKAAAHLHSSWLPLHGVMPHGKLLHGYFYMCTCMYVCLSVCLSVCMYVCCETFQSLWCPLSMSQWYTVIYFNCHDSSMVYHGIIMCGRPLHCALLSQLCHMTTQYYRL